MSYGGISQWFPFFPFSVPVSTLRILRFVHVAHANHNAVCSVVDLLKYSIAITNKYESSNSSFLISLPVILFTSPLVLNEIK